WNRFGLSFAFSPLLILTHEIRINFGLVCKIVGDGAVHLFQVQELEILTDCFRKLTSTKCVNDRIQRDPRPCNVKVAVAILNVFFGHVKIVPLLTLYRKSRSAEGEGWRPAALVQSAASPRRRNGNESENWKGSEDPAARAR